MTLEPITRDDQLERWHRDPAELWEALGELTLPPAWHADAACKEHPEITWFPVRGEKVTAAREVCDGCLVRQECLDDALDHGEKHGMWGGLSERQRKAMRRAG